MQNDAASVLLQFLFVSIATCVIYFVGFVLLPYFPVGKWEKKSVFTKPYFIMVLGLVAIVLLFSLMLAKGKSIHFLIIPVLISLFFLPREKYNARLQESWWRPILWLVIGGISFVVIFHLLPESQYKQMDAVHYSQLSQSLSDRGQENAFASLSLFGNAYVGNEPYHYFEFWWDAVLLKFFGDFLSGVVMLRFVCFATISSIALFGLFALAEKLAGKPLSIWQIFFCVAFVFYWPKVFTLFELIRHVFTYSFENNFIERPNLRTLYLFMPGLLINLKEKNNLRQILFWVICLMMASLAFFAIISPAVVLLCLIFCLKKWDGNKPLFVSLFICTMAASVGYLLFYYFFHTSLKSTTEGVTAYNLIKYVSRYWKIIALTSVTSVVDCLFIPVLFFMFLKNKNKIKLFIFLKQQQLILFLGAIILCGVVMARLFSFVDDAYQFSYASYTASGFIFFVLMLGPASHFQTGKALYGFVGFAIIFFFLLLRFVFPHERYVDVFAGNGNYAYGNKKFTNEYFEHLLLGFPLNAKVNGAFWADSLYYDTLSYYSLRNPNIYTVPSGYILAGKLKYNYEVCLSDSASIMHNVDTTQKVSYTYLRSAMLRSAFYRYPSQNINAKRLSFIKQYQLQYLILTKNADTSIIKQLKVEKYFQDANTGERFYLLDNNNFSVNR